MINYYTTTTKTEQDFYNTVFQNYINHAKKQGEKICFIPIMYLNLSAFNIAEIAQKNGLNARHYKNRTIIVKL